MPRTIFLKKSDWGLLLGPFLFVLSLLFFTDSSLMLSLGIIAWMLTWWIGSEVPMGVTALLPILLFPLCGIADIGSTAANYGHPIIFLFLGGFILALGLEKWQLHKRLALAILLRAGKTPQAVLLGSMLATASLSMWISNTATALMMLPIALSIIGYIRQTELSEKDKSRFAIGLLLGIAYAANIGGIATLIGTPPNLVLASMLSSQYGIELSFVNWLLFGLPLSSLLFISVYWLNTRLLFRMEKSSLLGLREVLKEELAALGSIKLAEKRMALVFGGTALLWIFRSLLNRIPALENLSDTGVALLGAVSLFVLPSGESGPLLQWKDTRQLAWGIILLFGGGLAIAMGMEKSGVVEWVQMQLQTLDTGQGFVALLLVTLFAIFLTELMSNVALVSVFIPICLVAAEALDLAVLTLALPLTVGASCAFMFPISTPPNAIVFSSGHLRMADMAKSGIWLNLICALIISLYCYFFLNYWSVLT